MSAETILLSLGEVTIKPRPICPTLNALAMVQIIFPVANIPLLAIVRLEGPKSIGLVILPLSLICVTTPLSTLSTTPARKLDKFV